jgi:hypothetical protein
MGLLVFMVEIMATASVEASMEPNMATHCHVHPDACSCSTYNMIGMSNATVPPTTRKASTSTGASRCILEQVQFPPDT